MKKRIKLGSEALPFETNTNLFAPLFDGQNGQRWSALGQTALAGNEIETVAMIVAANFATVEKLTGGLKIGIFMGTLAREGKIFALDERQDHLASAEVDFFHRSHGEFADARDRDITHAH